MQVAGLGLHPPGPLPPRRVFSQDASRIGLMPIRRRRLTLRGISPVGSGQDRFESSDPYGAVKPTTGRSFFLELPRLEADCFHVFVERFAAPSADSFNLFVLDNGACHTAKRLRLPPTLVFVPLPPYSPELNPIERRSCCRRLLGAASLRRTGCLWQLFERVHNP